MKRFALLFMLLILISCSSDDNHNTVLIGSWTLSEEYIDDVLVKYPENSCDLFHTLTFTNSKLTNRTYNYDYDQEICNNDFSLTGSYTFDNSTIVATNLHNTLYIISISENNLIFEIRLNNSVHLYNYKKN